MTKMYTVSRWSYRPKVEAIEVTKETACYMWAGKDRHDKENVYATFEEAKARLVHKMQTKVEAQKRSLAEAEANLARAEALAE
jgi:hypothetical protein